jgi:glyoxylase-like metal-dependent hydrolase (beta-lactamase superfamily II)
MNIFTIPGKDYDSNVYVIVGETPTIIDTGTGFQSHMIIEAIKKKININKIRQIFLTHEHYDHVGGVQDILQATRGSARIFAHKDIVSKLKEGKSTFAEMLGGVMPNIEVDVSTHPVRALGVSVSIARKMRCFSQGIRYLPTVVLVGTIFLEGIFVRCSIQ